MTQLNKPVAPALPWAALDYDRAYQDQLSKVLRLYFNQIDTTLGAVVGRNGGQYVECPNGLFFNTADQTFAAINTAYPIVFNQTYLSNAVALQTGSTSRIEVTISGVYNFQYTGQVQSTSSSAKELFVWIARNGTDIGYSTRAETVTTNNGYTGFNWSFDIDLAANDYIEFKAAVTDTALKLDAVTATAPHPGIPSSVMTVNFIAPLPDPRPIAP